MHQSPSHTGLIAAFGNIGALLGGVCCGALSEKLGRRRTIVLVSLLAIPMVPLWAWSHSAVMLAAGGFLIQFMVQGAWGIIPAHLNELSPAPVRAVLPAGGSLPDLLAIAALSAVFANLVNNLPATLMLIPVVASTGRPSAPPAGGRSSSAFEPARVRSPATSKRSLIDTGRPASGEAT